MILVPRKISQRRKEKIRNYTYSYCDNCPEWFPKNFGLNPFYEWIARSLPRWVSPNLVTLVGYSFMLSVYGLNCYFNPSLLEPQSCPKWAYALSGILYIV